MTNLPAIQNNYLPVGSLEGYLARVNQIPLLTKEEEQDLAIRWQTEQDLQAAQTLVLSHLRYVVRIAKGYMGYGLQLSDLIQEGTIGLMKAVKRFQPNKEVRLVSFAVHWIKAEMHEFIIKNWRIVKIATTKAQRKLFFNLRKSKKRLGWLTRSEVESVAEDLGVKPAEVLHMENRLNAQDAAFDMPAHVTDSDVLPTSAPAGYLAAPAEGEPLAQLESANWHGVMDVQLKHALSQLDERSRLIIEARWLQQEKKKTLQTLSSEFGVSIERIRQLEKAALEKLKAYF